MRAAGVDGCKGGWVCVLDGVATVHTRFDALMAALPVDTLVGVDMPIGLLDELVPGGRVADRLARTRLGPVRGTSVFSSPPRIALDQWRKTPDYPAVKAAVDGHLTKQAFFILDKIAELDDYARAHGQDRLAEIHPELGFMELAGEPLREPKRGLAGRTRRLELLARAGIPVPDRPPNTSGPRVAWDDLLDATVVAWSAARVVAGVAGRVPDPPPVDRFGLRMEVRW
jgi:predicted RNase H-like nuclease